jgi:hypothetical protein
VISYAKANSKMADSLSKVKDILKIGKKKMILKDLMIVTAHPCATLK